MTIWQVLGVDRTVDERAIKRAYATKLKVTRPEDDPAAFQLLSDAYQQALAQVRQQAGTAPLTSFASAQQIILRSAAVEQKASQITQPLVEEEPNPAHPAPKRAPRPMQPVQPIDPAQPVQQSTRRAAAVPAGPSAAEQAAVLWSSFIGASSIQPSLHLKKLSDGDELLNLEVREQFELCAARYCASDACSVVLRDAVVRHFQWENDRVLIAHYLPDETRQLMAHLRAERSWVFFQHQNTNPAVKALINKRPGTTWVQTCDAKFMRKMRELIQLIQEQHQDLLDTRLDRQHFAEWEGRVARKRYFVQTAIHSFLVGLVIEVLAMCALNSLGAGADRFPEVFLGAMVVSFGAFAWYAFMWSGAASPLRNSALGARINYLLYDLRYQPRWQFAWLAPFICVSTLMLIPHPGPLLGYFVGVSLLACVFAASFAMSIAMPRPAFVGVIICSIGLGTALSGKALAFNMLTCILGAYCFLLMLLRGGSELLQMSTVKPGAITALRLGWIAGAMVLSAGAHFTFAFDTPVTYAVVSWLWLCGGALLTYPGFNPFYALVGTVIAQLIVFYFGPKPSLLATQPMSELFAGMLYVTIFISANMIRARGTQHSLQ